MLPYKIITIINQSMNLYIQNNTNFVMPMFATIYIIQQNMMPMMVKMIFNDFAETIQNDKAEFYSSYNNLCRINDVFDKFYLN